MTKRSGVIAVKGDVLRRQLEQEALEFCQPRGGALAIVDSRSVDPEAPDYPSATVDFRCVSA